MIRFSLICRNDHEFDSWFQSGAACDALLGQKKVECMICGSAEVKKGLMAPAVSQGSAPPRAESPSLGEPSNPVEEALAAMRRHVEENAEYVGLGFAAEARAIHAGEAPQRSIYGEAKGAEARSLIEDGIPVAPLPFVPARRVN